MPGAIVVGAGPGVGTSVAQRLAREGLTVGVIARTEATVDDALSALSDYDALGVTADVTDEVVLRAALDEIVDRFGVPELLVYNAALIQSDSARRAHGPAAPRRLGGERRRCDHRRHPSRAADGAAAGPARSSSPAACPSPCPRQRACRSARPGSERSHNSSPQRTAQPVCTSRPSRSPARSAPGTGIRSRRHRRALLAAARPAAGSLGTRGHPHGRAQPLRILRRNQRVAAD